MSAARLREAARVLRERAEVSSTGPWAWERTEKTTTVYEPDEDAAIFEDELTLPEDAALIATMHPGVALALADWLAAEADFWTVDYEGADGEDVLRSALAVSDLILASAS